MQLIQRLAATGSFFWVLGLCALVQSTHPVKSVAEAAPKHAGYYVDPATLSIQAVLPAPPAQDSTIVAAELAELHRIESTRTPAQVAAAVADDREEDIFSYRTVLGEGFRADRLPLTAALSMRVHGEEGAVSGPLKQVFDRPRPYQVDKTLHPVCKLTPAHNSYPSGHTLSGYLLAFTLAELLPEKKQQILNRADDYANNRLVCGVHYPSDLEASKRTAYVVFGSMMANPRFLQDLRAVRAELHSNLD